MEKRDYLIYRMIDAKAIECPICHGACSVWLFEGKRHPLGFAYADCGYCRTRLYFRRPEIPKGVVVLDGLTVSEPKLEPEPDTTTEDKPKPKEEVIHAPDSGKQNLPYLRTR